MTHDDTLERATCEECGDTFIRAPGEDWKRLCLPCWKASPAPKKAARDKLAQLTAELAEVRAERDRLRLRVLTLEHADTRRPSRPKCCWPEHPRASAPTAPAWPVHQR